MSFASATAEATGKDRRTDERGVARGEQSRLKEIIGTSLDKGTELDALAKLKKTDPVKRDTLIDLAKAGKKVSARTPTRIMTVKQQAKLVSRECRFRDVPPRNATWQLSISNMAKEAIELAAYWKEEFGDWERFDVPSDIVELVRQAAQSWAGIVSIVDGMRPKRIKPKKEPTK